MSSNRDGQMPHGFWREQEIIWINRLSFGRLVKQTLCDRKDEWANWKCWHSYAYHWRSLLINIGQAAIWHKVSITVWQLQNKACIIFISYYIWGVSLRFLSDTALVINWITIVWNYFLSPWQTKEMDFLVSWTHWRHI